MTNKRGNTTAFIIMTATILGLVIALITLGLQLKTDNQNGCDVTTERTLYQEPNACTGDLASTISKRCEQQGYDGYDARQATCTDGTLTYECLTVKKECS
jgi:hypothetical protein